MTITLFSNIPNPYNDRLLAALRASGTTVRAVYKSAPPDEGRSWPVQLGDDDVITGSPRAEAREWKAAGGTDVILSGNYATGFDALRRLSLSKRASSLHVWGERLQDNNQLVHTLRRGYFAPWRLDGIFAVGTRAAASYREVTGRDTPIHVFPYTTDRGLDIDPKPSAEPTIGFAGRLLAYKGIDVVLRALGAVPAGERPRLAIAGSGPEEPTWRALAGSVGVSDHVDWLGDLTPAELDIARSHWWTQVVPSQRSEGWGVVVHEAMNTAVPVIASAHVNAAKDLIKSGRNGTVIDADGTADPDAWAAAIAAALDPERRDTMGAAARAVGAEFAPVNAAPWLADVVVEAARCRAGLGARPASRSFVEDAWTEIRLRSQD
jgi:glycosyltransferase involved in cell wall biosynthesis